MDDKDIVHREKFNWYLLFHPVFDWGMHHPAPYIWAGWWLITFDPFSIAFMPD